MNRICNICKETIGINDATVRLRDKGCKGVLLASAARGDNITVTPGDVIHTDCRRDYCNSHSIQRDQKKDDVTNAQSLSLRSRTSNFEFSKHCLFCGRPAKLVGFKRGHDVFPIRTFTFQNNIHVLCNERKDNWSEEVKARIEFVHDLHAADALYHQQCSVNFRTGKQIPNAHSSETQISKPRTGRPSNSQQNDAFLQVVHYLHQNDDEQITVSDLVEQMKTICGEDAYSMVHMKRQLISHFDSDIMITEINGKANVVTFMTTASTILQKFYERPQNQDTDMEKRAIIETAAKLIKREIQLIDADKRVYPPASEVLSTEKNIKYIPETLQAFLKLLFVNKESDLKIASIGQAIIQATRPRFLIAPLQIGLGIQMHHQFSSKFLIDILNKLGFCSSYFEVQKFEVNAAAAHDTDVPPISSDHVVQFIADNVDHNVGSLDGHNTFHGMGIIAGITPGITSKITVPRKVVTMQEITALAKIEVNVFRLHKPPLESMLFDELSLEENQDKTWKLDLLSKIAWPIRTPLIEWSAMMHMFQCGDHPGKSSIVFLPMIDMNPGDLTCIYSTLKFVVREAARHNVTPIITFDQPLYWKALTVISHESADNDMQSIVLRLGGFHMQMSFLGCIGNLMTGSGIQELFETVYASNSVSHMLSGKAVSRAVRAHLLADTVLNALLVSDVYGIPLPSVSRTDNSLSDNCDHVDTESAESAHVGFLSNVPNGDLKEAVGLFDNMITGDLPVESICTNRIFDDILSKLTCHKKSLSKQRTSVLWLQYMEMVDILRQFIKAERTGDWQLHLHSVQQMLPYFAASGHNLYAKSAYVYLQTMQHLARDYEDIYASFQSGQHIIRRSERFWAGLSTDLVIEQVLMRSLKTNGGLTRGRGMNESQRALWILSMPACAEMNDAMQDLTGVNFITSDQHKGSGNARKQRNDKDCMTFLSYIKDRNPFHCEESLFNIETGVVADASVNVDQAKDVGMAIVQSMKGQHVTNFTFKRANKAVTMNKGTNIGMDSELIQVDSQLLFQRLIVAANNIYDNVSEIFAYELSSVPSSLFETSGLFRPAQKSSLLEAIWCIGDCGLHDNAVDDVDYVIDGGYLLYRIPWPKGSTFASICKQYEEYVCKRYNRATIVFDGYISGPSTKDPTHLRRTKGAVGSRVIFNEETPFKGKKEMFLANTENKQNFVNFLSQKLVEKGCNVLHARADADVLITQTAVENALKRSTVLIGNDTDLLVLLLFHADINSRDIFFQSDQLVSKKHRIWDIRKTKVMLGIDTCRHLMFMHAMTGCDTTSRMFGIGKGIALKKMRTDGSFKEHAELFLGEATNEQIRSSGEEAILLLYNGLPGEGLDNLRYRRFNQKVATSTTVLQVQTLPPTSAAAKYHSYRVYLQVQQWKQEVTMRPESWGWRTDNTGKTLVPVTTDILPAPGKLLKMIRCQCKTGCDTKRCSCRKHGLECTPSCSECNGVSCSNAQVVVDGDD